MVCVRLTLARFLPAKHPLSDQALTVFVVLSPRRAKDKNVKIPHIVALNYSSGDIFFLVLILMSTNPTKRPKPAITSSCSHRVCI